MQNYANANLEVYKAAAIAEIQETKAINVAQRKEYLKEVSIERRKAQYEELLITGEGVPVIHTCNLTFMAPRRRICNFIQPTLERCVCIKNQEVHYRFCCIKNGKKAEFYCSGYKSGNLQYLWRKFCTAGCEFYAPKLSCQKNYLHKLWFYLLNNMQKDIWVPQHRGWQYDQNGKIIFVDEGVVLWEEICAAVR